MFKYFLLMLLIVSCAHQKTNEHEYQIGAYLWQQHSGEYQALCYQAYNLARIKLDRDLEDKHNRKRAVIFDIDETVFNNTFIGARMIKENIPWSKKVLNDWVKERNATAIAGAREFIEYAVKNRVEVFYISDRKINEIDDTFLNFKLLKIPAKKENFFFKSEDGGKESRRKEILKKYEVVLYFGDNLHDFDKIWDDQPSNLRKSLVDERRQDFGNKFIILPNPLYGDWENSLPKVNNRAENLIINP